MRRELRYFSPPHIMVREIMRSSWGEGLKGLPRDSFVVGTAVPPDGLDNRTGKFINPFDPQAYIKKAEESLKRFGIDHVDFLLFPYAGKREMG